MGTIEQQILSVVENHLSSNEARKAMADNAESLLDSWGRPDKTKVDIGRVHFKFETILKDVSYRTNLALVVLFFPYRGSKSDKKFLVQQYHDYIQSHSYPQYVNSDYDCSGHYFGSRWNRLRATFDDYGLSVVVEHSFRF